MHIFFLSAIEPWETHLVTEIRREETLKLLLSCFILSHTIFSSDCGHVGVTNLETFISAHELVPLELADTSWITGEECKVSLFKQICTLFRCL